MAKEIIWRALSDWNDWNGMKAIEIARIYKTETIRCSYANCQSCWAWWGPRSRR